MRYAELSRLWTLGGAVAAVGVLLAGWFLLVSPQWQQIEATSGEVLTITTRNDAIALRNAELRAAKDDEETHQAALQAARTRLPSQPLIAGFGEELTRLADGALVTLSRLSASDPQPAGEDGELYSTAVTFTVLGTGERVDAFLASLLGTEQRALLVSGVEMLPVNAGSAQGLAGDVVATVNATVWTLPDAAGEGDTSDGEPEE